MALSAAGKNGLSTLVLTNPSGSASTQVYLHGATVTSWLVNGVEKLFVSSQAVYNGVNAIRGGIPIVFPQFGQTGPLKQHGFARNQTWSFSKLQVDAPKDEVALELTLQDNETTKQEWNGNQFTLVYTIVLGKTTLATHLSVENKNEANAFSFTTALHTYFAAEDIHKVSVRGLKGKQYTDKMRNGQEFTEAGESLTFTEETDRVYHSIEANATVHSTDNSKHAFSIANDGFGDIVVWNPWIAKSKAMPDFGDDEWPYMYCVEVSSIQTPVTVAAGATWKAGQILTAL